MNTITLNKSSFRDKVNKCYETYINLSKHNTLAIGIYHNDNFYVFGNGIDNSYKYDIGSISKTITAHLVLYLSNKKLIDLDKSIDNYLSLKKGKYPTTYQLLTHTAGYNNLTPIEITIPNLLRHGYSKKNIYENCNNDTIINSLNKRRNHKDNNSYGYSDFAYAILACICEKVSNTKFSLLIEDFVKNKLDMKDTDVFVNKDNRYPLSIKNNKILPYWKWNNNNPYIASGGLSSNIIDMLKYIKLQITSIDSYITNAHKVCENSFDKNSKIGMCIGWHTYKKSNQLWHVGGVGTFRSSIIINKHKKCGVIVFGNAKGIKSANVHYLAKMIYSEIKIKKIKY